MAHSVSQLPPKPPENAGIQRHVCAQHVHKKNTEVKKLQRVRYRMVTQGAAALRRAREALYSKKRPDPSEEAMTKQYVAIDIDPVDAARGSSASGSGPAGAPYQAPSFGKRAEQAAAGKPIEPQPVHATIIGESPAPTQKKPSIIGGAVQTAVGGAIMLVGVPMLILPGPGLLAIGGGAVVAANGIKKMLGK